MTFCVRYRFKLLFRLQIEKGAPVDVTVPGLPVVTFEIGEEAHPVGHWVTAKIDGFDTEEKAREAGQQLGDTLLVVGAVRKLGIDIGFSRSNLRLSNSVHAAVREKTGKELRTETHGLMVYKKDTVLIVDARARGHASMSTKVFEELLANWIKPSSALTERQRNCVALINDSFFVTRTEGQFILRISAVEALCDQTVRDARYQSAIEELEQHLSGQVLDAEIRETLQRTLINAKRQSLRQAYMTKFKTLRSVAEARAFDALYQERSKLIHAGIGRGGLTEAASGALQLAVDLLEAELQQG